MSDLFRVRLTAGEKPGAHKLEIQAPDGTWVDISSAVRHTVTHAGVGDYARMEISPSMFAGHVEGSMQLVIPRESARMLRSFGWMLPEGTFVNADGSVSMRMNPHAWALAHEDTR